MSIFRSHNEQNTEQTVDRHALIFGLISVFLCGIGFSIIMPVVPFLVQPYTSSPGEQAIVVTLLTSVYAVCVFFAAPALGALSDKFGRRPLLLVCLLGSAIGYLVFGIGGALWVLFAGRIIEGITGGSISTIFAYFADIDDCRYLQLQVHQAFLQMELLGSCKSLPPACRYPLH